MDLQYPVKAIELIVVVILFFLSVPCLIPW